MPLSDTNAGFKYDPGDNDGVRTHQLNYYLIEVRPVHRKARFVSESIDYSNREVFTIGSGVHEVIAQIRFDRFGQDLLDMLRNAADGVTLTYYPNLDYQQRSYDLELIDIDDEIVVQPDADRQGKGEKSIEVRLRSADGSELSDLFTPHLFIYEAGYSIERATFSRGSDATFRAEL